MLFYPGQTVICVNDDFSWALRHYAFFVDIRYPVAGQRYVIREYILSGPHVRYPAVALVGITNPSVVYMDGVRREAGFWDRRFRPVTDISLFEALLRIKPRNKVKETENA